MKGIKAVFFDIDGTLVSFKTHEVSAKVRASIERMQRNGIKCFISSGRHLDNIDNLGALHFDGFVTVNGGMTYLDGRLIDSNPIAKSDVRTMLDIVYPDNLLAVSFVLRDGLVMNTDNERSDYIFEQLQFKKRPRIVDLRTLADEDVYQMISFFDREEEPAIMRCLPHCQSARWSPIFTDVVPRGQSKVRGIDKLCATMGITPSECMAFGDGGNDVEMLRHVGLGVAMGNASDDVKAEADEVCPSVDDDGIAWMVERLGL
jgi:Cof subfamily protein (haloacid dehalogenase superfamily)